MYTSQQKKWGKLAGKIPNSVSPLSKSCVDAFEKCRTFQQGRRPGRSPVSSCARRGDRELCEASVL